VVEAALLTAARYHATRALVTISYQPRELKLEVDGNVFIPDLYQSLRAIAQRVALYDGRLRVLPANGGRFLLQARLPAAATIPA
jgi:signal transduction histidine kinase